MQFPGGIEGLDPGKVVLGGKLLAHYIYGIALIRDPGVFGLAPGVWNPGGDWIFEAEASTFMTPGYYHILRAVVATRNIEAGWPGSNGTTMRQDLESLASTGHSEISQGNLPPSR
jgi:hypothetical protein